MDAHKLQVKLFATAGALPPPSTEAFIHIFHSWIKNRVLPELMIDVANYAHVPKGPGVILIGHACDTSIDEADGRLGVLHNRKRTAPAPAERLTDAFRRVLHAAILLQAEPTLAGKVRFAPGEFLFRINDRLLAPNNDQTFAALKPELDALAARLFEGPADITRVGDAKTLFSVRIAAPEAASVPPLATLLARLGGPPGPDGAIAPDA
jgi:hypothetical protein